MAMKQSGRKQYTTMQGKKIDMDLLRQRNELTPAVGNARVNARGDELGPGGKIIQEIQKESGATVLVEEVEENGIVSVFASNQDEMDNAVERVKAIVAVPEVGETYVGKVKSIKDFGAFIEFMPGKDGLLHISEIKWERVESMDGVLEEGEEIKVKLIEVDRRTGKFRLSRKALIPKPEK